MDASKKQQFLNAFSDVFDANLNITACGRDKCRTLIKLCQEIDPAQNFGNPETGIMHVLNIRVLFEKINRS